MYELVLDLLLFLSGLQSYLRNRAFIAAARIISTLKIQCHVGRHDFGLGEERIPQARATATSGS